MSEPLYPKGTIVRFKIGPMGVVEDINVPGVPVASKDDGPKSLDGYALAWPGDQGIYVRDLPGIGTDWHLVMVDKGDVPVMPHMIEEHPDYAEKNQGLKESV
jgi:hypothetical protein